MTDPSQNGDAAPSSSSVSRMHAGVHADMPAWLSRHPWLPLVLPFVVYMICGTFEPTREKPFSLLSLTIEYSQYPAVYTIKILLTMAAIAAVWPGYRQFPFRLSALAPAVGVVGVVLWIGICKLDLETRLLEPLGFGSLVDLGRRAAFNPLEAWPDDPLWAYGFLAIRFWGLVAVVPLVEEFFIRAFVMRYVVDPDWWKIPFGTLTPTAIAAGTLLPVLMHPAELFAAAVWFTLITWLMFKTRNIWDCVAAHAVTNLLLGVWVVARDEWHFM